VCEIGKLYNTLMSYKLGIKAYDVSREGLKFYPGTVLFLFYQSTVLSSHVEDRHQMYFGGSVVGMTSTICIDISPTPS